MTTLIIAFGTLMIFAGALLLKNPDIVFGYLKKNYEKPAIQVIAVVARLLVGALLITQSGFSKFPLTIEVIGWIFIVSGIILALIGRSNFRRLMSWVLNKFKPLGRVAGLFSIAFGGFLVYAYI